MDSVALERPSSDSEITSRSGMQTNAGEAPAERSPIRSCEALEGLNAIKRPEVELVIWQRALPSCFQDWLAQLEASLLPNLRVLVRPDDFIKAMDVLLDGDGMAKGAMRSLLICDIHSLVSAFARLSGSDLVDVRLERVSDDACWKFHRDCVEARLLTTYRGAATEWVQPDQSETALKAQTRYDGPIERLGANDVAVFKGSCAADGSGIVHRSPPIAGSGQTRLLLCLNKPSAVSPDPWSDTTKQ